MTEWKELALPPRIKSGRGFESLTPQQYEERKASVYNASAGHLDAVDGYTCDLCKNRGYTATVEYNEAFGYYYEALVPCKCQRVRDALRRLQASGLKNVVKDFTFDRYDAADEWQQRLKDKAVQFCKDDAHTWLFMGGQSGAGKTHLCTAVTVHYIRKGKEARYMLWRDEIAQIKAIVTDSAAYAARMDALKKTPVLYIDDLFKGGQGEGGQFRAPTEADIKAAFEIINYRYNNPDLITIISSERTIGELSQIDEAIAGRIAERAKAAGYCLSIKRAPGRNWRLKDIEEV